MAEGPHRPLPIEAGSLPSGPPGLQATLQNGWGVVRNFGILFGVAALFIILSVSSSVFLTQENLFNVLNQTALVGIIACAGTLVVLGAGVDLSVAAIYAVAGIVAVKISNSTSVPVGFLAGILTGVLLGAANGLLSSYGRINSLIATLASALAIRGIANVITGGNVVSAESLSFQTFGNGGIGQVTNISVVFLVVAAVLWFVLARTVVGRWIYATGGNAAAARLAGIRVNWIRIGTFVLSGAAAAVAGVLASSRLGQGEAGAGAGLEISALTAIFVGGTSLAGGYGAIWRTLAGAFLLTLINNGFTLLELDPTYEQIVEGVIILVAVAADAWSRRGSEPEH